jgi:phenylacetate-CoA ligase
MNPHQLRLQTSVSGVAWPSLPGPAATQLLALLYQLEQSERWPREQIAEAQLEQLGELVTHARRQSPFYRARLVEADLLIEKAWGPESLSRLPVLTRRELLLHADSIHCDGVPAAHGEVGVIQTSGATGQPVKVRRTAITQLKWLAFVMREHLWHERDFTRSLAVVRANVGAMDDDVVARRNGWGPPVSLLYASGPCYSQPLGLNVEDQAKWLLRRDPSYLLTYPSNLAALLDEFERLGEAPRNIRELRTVGETLPGELPARCASVLGARVTDTYSSQEVGAIAIQCPESGLYHLQAESLIVEVLRDDGHACAAGEIGRVVVTDLHNFATPLLRYDLGDYAEVAGACSCGRGLPTLRRIIGRERNLVRLPTGQRFWPFVGYPRFAEVAKVLQYQVIQHTSTELEARLVVQGNQLDEAQRVALTTIIQQALGYPFAVRFTLFPAAIPRGASGKFEEFQCLIQADERARLGPKQ